MPKFISIPKTDPLVYVNLDTVDSFSYNKRTGTLYMDFISSGETQATFKMSHEDYLNFLHRVL